MAQDRSSLFALAAAVLAMGAMLLILNSANTSQFEASSIGTRGLGYWLEENGIEVEQANRRTSLAEEDVSLRILPLYDITLNQRLVHPINEDGKDPQHSERQISLYTVNTKIQRIPTLLILPKWFDRAGELNLFDAQLQHSAANAQQPLIDLGTPQLKLKPSSQKLLRQDGYVLYQPQLFVAETVRDGCRPHLMLGSDVLVAECKRAGTRPYFILSDPDVLNNHGLALGENASHAIDLIQGLIADNAGTVFIDTSDRPILRQDVDIDRRAEPRSAEDLARYFTYPFNLIFISAGLTFLILIWRGLIRFGPPKKTNTGAIDASKTASINAKSYLLRLTGEDHALLSAYVSDKMNALARDVMGRSTHMDQPQFIKRLRKIAPTHAKPLETALADLAQTGPQTPKADLQRLIETFDHTYRRLRDELGHVSRHG